ncbi:hypothetical protein N7481_003870 [Penicillium waksmanii]|uniref:uncharacterized protein n=1 Tax=Penicillium waksmanii TaxID=69791 RepID=UPI00254762D2|nr:uncharacterized protein N7481_003870 [Penicillium waksmanii]KAJ5988660.1 hypothetical protein N7481_003870 [Penicillium waksmanii]
MAKAESLCLPLKALREMIEETRITQPETSADLSEQAMSINASITRLREILKRYGPTGASDSFPGKARDQLKRAMYHFRKDNLSRECCRAQGSPSSSSDFGQ